MPYIHIVIVVIHIVSELTDSTRGLVKELPRSVMFFN